MKTSHVTRTARWKKSNESRAFGVMLAVKRALTTGMLTYGENRGWTILESSEDSAAKVIEQALRDAEQRGMRRMRTR